MLSVNTSLYYMNITFGAFHPHGPSLPTYTEITNNNGNVNFIRTVM
jgi:hypothetical protein